MPQKREQTLQKSIKSSLNIAYSETSDVYIYRQNVINRNSSIAHIYTSNAIRM